MTLWGVCAAAWMLAMTALGVDGDESMAPQPHPRYSPEEVVRIQLGALSRNDEPYPDAGIEITYRFASPANRASTGPLDRFAALVKNPLYRDMINHRSADYGPVTVEDGWAQIPVIVTARDGSRVGYVFVLSRQRGGVFDRCWMTDSVAHLRLREPRRGGSPGAIGV